MANPIEFSEVFDVVGLKSALSELVKEQKQASNNISQDIKIIIKLREQELQLIREQSQIIAGKSTGDGASRKALQDEIKQLELLIQAKRQYDEAIKGGKGVNAELVAQTKRLNDEFRKSQNELKLAKISGEEYKKKLQEIKNEANAAKIVLSEHNKTMAAASGSYNEANKRAQELLRSIKAAKGGFESTSPVIQNQIKEYNALFLQLKKFDEQLGHNYRNVGNYKSGFNGLGNSINQLSRELPAFTYSAQTGFLALSNNLPILADEIGKLKDANALLVKDGGKAIPIWKQLAGALFSWQTLMSVGITLVVIYGKEIANFFSGLAKGNQVLKESEIRIKAINSAYESDSVKTAVKNVIELRSELNAAKKGFADKKEVVDKYNSTIGLVTGSVKSLKEVEQGLIDNTKAYFEAMVKRSAADIIAADAAQTFIDLQKAKQKDESEFLTTSMRISSTYYKDVKDNAATLNEIRKQEVENRKKVATEAKNAEIKRLEENLATQYKLLDGFGLTYEKFENDKVETSEQRAQRLSKLIETRAKLDVSNQEKLYNEGVITQEDFEAKKLQILVKSYNDRKQLFSKNSDDYIALQVDENNAIIASLEFLKQQEKKSYDEMRRLEKEDDKNNDKALKDKIDSELNASKQIYTADIEGLKNNSVAKLKAQLEYLDRDIEIKKRNAEDTTDLELKKQELLTKLTESGEQRRKDIRDQFIQSSFQVANMLADEAAIRQGIRLQSEQTALQKEYDYKRELAGDNEEAQKQLDREFENKQRELRRREAVAAKNNALFNIALSTAQGIVNALATGNIPLSVSVGIIGALQAALVASRPIPSFWKGTDDSPEGYANVAEHGSEYIQDPRGNLTLAKKKQVTYLEKHSKVYTASQTRNIQDLMNQFDQNKTVSEYERSSSRLMSGNEQLKIREIALALESNRMDEKALTSSFEKAIKTIPLKNFAFDERGYSKFVESKGHRTKYVGGRNRL